MNAAAVPPLYMICIPFYRAAFHEWAYRRGLTDPDHAMHCLLTEVFGDKVLRPFRLISGIARNAGSLYGYARQDGGAMQAHGQLLADPLQAPIFDLGRPFPTKDMAPLRRVPTGARHGFELRVRPTTRRMHRSLNGQPPRSREHDAYHAYLHDHYPFDYRPPNRHEVRRLRHLAYMGWLEQNFDTQKGVHLEPDSFHITHFRRVRSVRRRGQTASLAPELVCRGNLVVRDTENFLRLVETGVGRHRAYGYGMLLLRQLHPTRHAAGTPAPSHDPHDEES